MKFILASKSPRRAEILSNIGLDFSVKVSSADENVPDEIREPKEVVRYLAGQKSTLDLNENEVAISADTLVFLDGMPLGKPKDKLDAVRILRMLSGREHTVATGFAIRTTEKLYTEAVESKVFFKKLSDDEIDCYVATGEPLDKAGAYGIQGQGSMLIESISGDYFNIVGLPICALTTALSREFGIDIWKEIKQK